MSPDYYRGVQAAFEALQAGHSVHGYLRCIEADEMHSGPDDFNTGAKEQCLRWPEVIDLPPASYVEQTGGRACGVFIGVALLAGLFAITGFPKLPGPAVGYLLTVTVVAGIAGYRNMKP